MSSLFTSIEKKPVVVIADIFRKSLAAMILSDLVVFSGSLINGILISRFLGMESMAAFQIAAPFFLFVTIIEMIFSNGLRFYLAKSIGVGDMNSASRNYSSAYVVVGLLSVAIAAAVYVFADVLAEFLGASGESEFLLPLVVEYFHGMAVGYALINFVPMSMSVLFLLGERKTVLVMSAVEVIVQVSVGLLSVFYFDAGLFGMGMSQSLSYVFTLLTAQIMVYGKKFPLKFGFDRISFQSVKEIFTIGLPSAASQLSLSLRGFILNRILLLTSSAAAVAVYSNLNSISSVFLIGGIASCTFNLTGIFYAERDYFSLKRTFGISLKESIRIQVAISVLIFLAAPWITEIFVDPKDTEYFSMMEAGIRIFVWYFPLSILARVFQKFYNATEKIQLTFVLSLFDNLIFTCLFAAFLGYAFGEIGVWFSFIFAEIAMFFMLMLYVKFKMHGSLSNILDYMLLPRDFETAKDHEFSATAENLEDVLTISKQAQDFCLEYGMSKKNAMICRLTIEEMGRNLVDYAFKQGKNNRIDIRLFFKDEWIIRIRDNTQSFNPTDWLELHELKDPAENMGIKMICKMAKNVTYTSSMGMNNLLITI